MTQRIEPYKILEHVIEKKDDRPKTCWGFKKGTQTPRMDKLWNPWNEGKKKSSTRQGQKIVRETSSENWAMILGDCQKLKILGTWSKARVGLRQFKGVPRNTRNENRYVPISRPMMQKGIKKLRNQQFMNKRLVPQGTQKEKPCREVAGKLST